MLYFWLLAVALEVVLGVAFIVSGAEDAIEEGLQRAGIEFGSDLLTAARVVIAYPAAILGVGLAWARSPLPTWPSGCRPNVATVAGLPAPC